MASVNTRPTVMLSTHSEHGRPLCGLSDLAFDFELEDGLYGSANESILHCAWTEKEVQEVTAREGWSCACDEEDEGSSVALQCSRLSSADEPRVAEFSSSSSSPSSYQCVVEALFDFEEDFLTPNCEELPPKCEQRR